MDKKAKDILFKTYWTSGGWIDDGDRKTKPNDFDYAKSKGVMFDPFSISKSELVARLTKLLNKISKEDISNAFLCSLRTKQFELRSAIASYANALRIINGDKSDSWDLQDEYVDEDLNVLNFERIKWGGVRHRQALYNYFDLNLFSQLEIDIPIEEDLIIFGKILRTVEQSADGDYPSKLRDRLKDVYKSSKDERSSLLEILACCKILNPTSYDRPTTGRHDWDFVEYWRGEDKYDSKAVYFYFKRLF
ncbi:PIN domain-containing protein [Hymenobacter siberiensis]|uniref:hypothetical protein n=1 Tax=Hymenobacter siberiensis TaxID=2848396 RepID=UPI001C1E52D4|nr:hypothetical protein [Hymenobacter siberiensis]